MNNLLSYCGLVDARISASEKDSPLLGMYDFGPACLYRTILTSFVN